MKNTTLAILVGLLFFCCFCAKAENLPAQTENKSKWLDDYKKPVGLTYSAKAVLQTTYLWRGLYCGALNLQPSASVGYGGLYFNAWASVCSATWMFDRFQPEVDLTLGFARWGVDLSLVYIHNFDCRFFDFANYPDKGNRLEIDLRYTVSSKLPLSFLWATRIAASDSYLTQTGDTARAYSTYFELSYAHSFPYDITLRGAVGFTPWRSFYTLFQQDFACQNIELSLSKDWSLAEHCGLKLQGVLSINPSALAKDKTTAEWHPAEPYWQSINTNLALIVYLK